MISAEWADVAAARSPAAGKWALLIGLNEYRYAEEAGFEQLRGCVNDVEDVRALLVGTYGFPRDHVVVLTNARATRQAILAAIRQHLVERAGPDDAAVLYFSGHGSECFDPERISNRDQTIVPYDARDPDGAVEDVNGSDLNEALKGLRTSRGVFIFDSCHSGSMRSRNLGQARAIPASRRPLAPRAGMVRPLMTPDASYVLLAASAPDEESIEARIDGRPRGIFTYTLCRELGSAPSARTYRDVIDRIRPLMAVYGSSQHPRAEGEVADAYVFSGTSAPAAAYVLAWSGPEGRIYFDAGSELGLTEGSVFALYPPDTKQFDGSIAPIALVQLTRVDAQSAIGELVSGTPPPISARAVETGHRHHGAKVRLRLPEKADGVPLDLLRSRLKALDAVEVLDGGTDADCDLVLTSSRDGLAVGRPGRAVRATAISAGPSAVDALVAHVEGWVRWLTVLWLSNAPTRLAVDFDVELAPPENPGAAETVTCTIRNGSRRPVYITLLNLSDDGSIRLVYPQHEASLLHDGCTLRRRFELESVASGAPPSCEVVKMIATTNQRDFSVFEAAAIRSSPTNRDLAEQLMPAPPHDGGDRGITLADDWVAIERAFTYEPMRAVARSTAP